jgi:hypothetical protein
MKKRLETEPIGPRDYTPETRIPGPHESEIKFREVVMLESERDAIKQAVEAGYIGRGKLGINANDLSQILANIPAVLQDPAFWQALGKARRWSDISKFGDINFGRLGVHPGWLTLALRYFGVKLSGGDLNQFWESLP